MVRPSAAHHLLEGGEHHAEALIVLTLHAFLSWHCRQTPALARPEPHPSTGWVDLRVGFPRCGGPS
jgi:hypothetical protein